MMDDYIVQYNRTGVHGSQAYGHRGQEFGARKQEFVHNTQGHLYMISLSAKCCLSSFGIFSASGFVFLYISASASCLSHSTSIPTVVEMASV